MSSSCAMPASSMRPAVLRRCASPRTCRERCVTTCMRVGLSQRKNGLLSLLRLVDELERVGEDLVVDRLHPLRDRARRRPRSSACRPCPSAARRSGRPCRSPSCGHVARADLVLERRRVVRVARVLHRVEVVEVAEELVEAVHRRQELVEVAQVVLAELAGGVAHRLEGGGDRRRLRGHADREPAWPTVVRPVRIGSSPVMKLARPGGAARLGVVVGEAHALGGELVEVRRPAGHDAPGGRRRCWTSRCRRP